MSEDPVESGYRRYVSRIGFPSFVVFMLFGLLFLIGVVYLALQQ